MPFRGYKAIKFDAVNDYPVNKMLYFLSFANDSH